LQKDRQRQLGCELARAIFYLANILSNLVGWCLGLALPLTFWGFTQGGILALKFIKCTNVQPLQKCLIVARLPTLRKTLVIGRAF